MPEQLCNRPQIHTSYNKSTSKCMAVAMPGILMNLRLFETGAHRAPRDEKTKDGQEHNKQPLPCGWCRCWIESLAAFRFDGCNLKIHDPMDDINSIFFDRIVNHS